ncbi:ankyrin repeat ph and sec7 domain containing protein secg-related [Anaeramoeba ignava]|uniref:Ankyrin repeat ph and sec7 domain containing protein secg-related n=1 Tax=Anaeramoeba ignava TaxID=1746090 RepID=A0A9Q0LVT3_ANAIG|nr:ankyrin repeat ph and sec7 domain containing protein secg-related [Anaeramoeba ignava]
MFDFDFGEDPILDENLSLLIEYTKKEDLENLQKVLTEFESTKELRADVNFLNEDEQNCLHIAAKYSNSPEIIGFLFSKGVRYSKDHFKMTPLIYSLSHHEPNLETMKILFANGAKITETNPKKIPLLFVIIKAVTDEAIYDFLIEKGADIKQTYRDRTLLDHAILLDHKIEFLKYLIKKGISPKRKPKNTLHSLFHKMGTTKSTSKEVLDLFLSHGIDPLADNGSNTLLAICMRNQQNIEILKLILSYLSKERIQEYETKNPEYSLLFIALESRSTFETFKILIEAGTNINIMTSKGTPLLNAIERGLDPAILKFMIENGALSINTIDQSMPNQYLLNRTLHDLVRYKRDRELIDMLLKKGAIATTDIIISSIEDFDVFIYFLDLFPGNFPIVDHFWTISNHRKSLTFEQIKIVLTYLKDINEVNKYKETFLHRFVRSKLFNKEALDYFISKGANLFHRDDSFKTPFEHYLFGNCSMYEKDTQSMKEIIRIFIKQGADVNFIKPENGNHILHLLVAYNCFHIEVWEELLPYIQRIDPINKEFRNPEEELFFDLKTYEFEDDSYTQMGFNLLHFLKLFKSYSEDYLNFLERQELKDLEIGFACGSKFMVHRLILEKRIGKQNIDKFIQFSSQKTKEEMMPFLKWIYSGQFADEEFEKKQLDEFNKAIKEHKEISDYINDFRYEKFDATRFLVYEKQKEDFNHIFNFLKEINAVETEEEMKAKSLTSGVINDLKQLYQDEDSKDFVIVTEKERIKVHKLVLMARSELFRGMFVSVEDKTNQVSDYSGKSSESISQLIKFLYFDKFDNDLSFEVIEDLKELNIYYQLNQNSSFEKLLQFQKNFKEI